MQLVSSKNDLANRVADAKKQGLKVGFVPTMGALHRGHIALAERALRECDYVVVSIFVNPTQFNDPADLEKYPRTLEADLALLQAAGCHLVFAPEVQEMYPEAETAYLDLDFGTLATVMEGVHRPGHFDGVALVVHRLFEMVQPDVSYFGEKDFQQLAIIRSMVQQLQLPIDIVPCAIVREADGLAMSSRNMRLSPQHRAVAPHIGRSLLQARQLASLHSVEEVAQFLRHELSSQPLLRLEYAQIVARDTLLDASSWDEPAGCVACVAVWAGEVRLIDNVQF